MNKIYILIIVLLVFGCNSNEDFIGRWVVVGSTSNTIISLTNRESQHYHKGTFGNTDIDWSVKDGFLFYGGQSMKIKSTSKDELHFITIVPKEIEIDGKWKDIPVGTEEVWIRIP